MTKKKPNKKVIVAQSRSIGAWRWKIIISFKGNGPDLHVEKDYPKKLPAIQAARRMIKKLNFGPSAIYVQDWQDHIIDVFHATG